MKKITEETLNAIQENVRTRETQELDYKRDNLFKGSWKDFEIKDLKPNLIPNGWDSFVPYGSGENLVPNWDFSTNENIFVAVGALPIIENNRLKIHTPTTSQSPRYAYAELKLKLPIGDYRYRVKVTDKYNAFILPYSGVGKKTDISIIGGGVGEGNLSVVDESISILFYPMIKAGDGKVGDETFIEWIQITPIDNQHLVVEKTPLENGLTRIQTWGGNSAIKYRAINVPMTKDKKYTDSIYIENFGDQFIVSTNTSWNFATIPKGFIGLVSATNIAPIDGTTNFTFKGSNKDINLDFIASDPQIVEGDVPNPTMIVTPLSDGREHVQVYGATKDTKLVYSGDEGFVGENYGLKTTIENNGIDLDLSTSLTEEKKRIEKGENKVNLQGELSTKLSVEIGVPSE